MIIDSRYKVIEQIGSGVWANVYKVMDTRNGKLCTLKIYLHLDAQTLYEKFSAYDMYKITQLNHPNLVPVLTFGHVGKQIYGVYEYYKGTNLESFRLKMNRLNIFYEIIVQCLYALQTLHSQKIYHQDIKPSNILHVITNNNVEIKMIDYGFNKLDSEINQQTISGTLPYIAPELFQNLSPSPQSDFYALGVTLYKLSTGILPFSLEQISSIRSGNPHHFFPRFIREIYPEMNPALERFILKLIEKNPNDRFPDAQSAIAVINKIQSTSYAYSHRVSLIQSVNLNSSIIRAEYTDILMDHIKKPSSSCGKFITLYGGYGVGKDSILTLLKYHFFTDEYYIFDYTCSSKQRDPFFALMQEFGTSVLSKEVRANIFSDVSVKIKKLFETEGELKTIGEDSGRSKNDYLSGERFMDYLSDEKPILFIIRDAHNFTRETIDFINFISPLLIRKPIFIIASTTDLSKLQDIIYKIAIHVTPLTYTETFAFIQKLLNTEPTEKFTAQMHFRSCGNPYFIKEILLDLLQQKLLTSTANVLDFNVNFMDYDLPEHLLNTLMARIKHLDRNKANYLKKLSVVNTSISVKMITELLKLPEKRQFELLHDAVTFDIFQRVDGDYVFTLPEIKQYFFENCTNNEIVEISRHLIQLFNEADVKSIDYYHGIIKNAEYIGDYAAIRKFRLALYKVYSDKYDQIKAFNEIYKIIELDLSNQILVSSNEMRQDLLAFIEKADLSGFIDNAINLVLSFERDLDLFEWYFTLSSLYMRQSNFKLALENSQKARPLIKEDVQLAKLDIDLIVIYLGLSDYTSAQEVFERLVPEGMQIDCKVKYYDRWGLYLRKLDKVEDAIIWYEESIKKLEGATNIKMGSVYNNLGVCYTDLKMYNEAEIALMQCKEEWERINNFRSLGTIYVNLADMYLHQGLTHNSLEYLKKAEQVIKKVSNQRLMPYIYNNFGETFIKMGRFFEAVVYLNEGKKANHIVASQEIEEDLNNNLALALHKTNNYFQFYTFLATTFPQILDNFIITINPVVRSYIFYLYELGDRETIESIIYSDFNLTKLQEQDFYYQVLAMLSILKGDYYTAVNNYIISLEYVQKSKNDYALAIIYINLAIALCINNETDKATQYLDKAEPLITQNEYLYWEMQYKLTRMQVDCLDKDKPLRVILRDAFTLLASAKQHNFYKIEIELYSLIIHLYNELGAFKYSQAYYKIYTEKVRDAVRNLPENDQKRYIAYKKASLKNINDFHLINIVTRNKEKPVDWNQEILQLLRLEDSQRIKYFLDTKIQQFFSPYAYAVIIFTTPSLVKALSTKNYSLYMQKSFDDGLLDEKNIVAYINEVIEKDKIVTFSHDNKHFIICPILLKYSKIGFWILSDNGEMPFSLKEQKMLSAFSFHLSTMLIRVAEFEEENKKIVLMKELMNITGKMMSTYDIQKLESNILYDMIVITNASRGFFFKKDSADSYYFSAALDSENNVLSNVFEVPNTIIQEVLSTQRQIFIEDNIHDKTQKHDIAEADNIDANSLYCTPIFVDNKLYGIIYLDNSPAKEGNLRILEDIMNIFMIHVQLAILNALTYQSLAAKNRELLTLDTMKNNFLSIVSHELNTPLFTLQEHIQKLKRAVDSLDEETHESLSKADKSLKKLHKTIDDIITLNRYNKSNYIKKESIRIADLLTPIYNEVKSMSNERRINFKLEIPDGMPFVYVDLESMQILIKNILFNAIRFTQDYGTIVLGVRYSLFPAEKLEKKETIVIYVQDTGIGMAEKEQENIFKAFYELGDIYSHRSGFLEFRSGGLGVGLTIANRIIELHQGKITSQSKEKEGTTIFVSLPLE